MNTKWYVLGAVLGAAPGTLPFTPPPAPENEAPTVEPDSRTRATDEAGAARHPCQLITVMQVPCDPTKSVCEVTYWDCPEADSPYKA